MKIAREGLREILLATVFLLIPAMAAVWAALNISPWFWLLSPLVLLWLFTIAFFRDPHRAIPGDRQIMVSPADGKVTESAQLTEFPGFTGPVQKLSIFLSVFDVHINRVPCDGRIVSVEYKPGEFLDARHPECGIRNESNTIVIEPSGGIRGPIMVRQVAGLIARRIICNVKPGDTVKRGDRFGLIKFGSRTDLIVPADSGFQASVKIDEIVRGGSTIVMSVSADAKLTSQRETASAI